MKCTKLLVVIYVLCASLNLYAQTNTGYLGIEHGLSNNYVTKIYQDKYGFMWFGTYGGLNRFDGYTFKVYKNQPHKQESLPDNRITDIIENTEGTIWVATKVGAALLEKDGLNFQRLQLKKESGQLEHIDFAINQFARYDDKILFAASERAGLLKLNPSEENNSALSYTIPALIEGNNSFSYNVSSLAVHKDTLWLIIQHVGICFYDEGKGIVRVKKEGNITASSMAISDDGNIWFANNQGVTRFNKIENNFTYYTEDNGLSSNRVVNLHLGKDQKIWACTDGTGITRIDPHTGKMDYIASQKGQNMLTSDAVFAVYEDHQSRTWIGTLRGGINILDTNKGKFQLVRSNLQTKKINPSDFILSFAEGENQDVWVGTDGSGLMKWDRRKNKFSAYTNFTALNAVSTPLNNGFITGIVLDGHSDVWLSTYGDGIIKLNKKTGQTSRYNCFYPNSTYPNQAVWQLYKDRRNNIWASTLNGGSVFILDRKKDQFIPLGVDIYDVISIYEEDDDTFWFGSWADLTRLDLSTMKTSSFSIGSPIRFIHKGKDNTLWIGTEGGGLLKFNKISKKYTRFTDTDGLASNTLLNLLEDEIGNFWISTYNGISKFDPVRQTFQNFYESDGLQSNQFSYNAALKLKNGEMIFGGIRGFNVFQPSQIQLNIKPPRIAITNLLINNNSFQLYDENKKTDLSAIQRLTIPYDEAVVSVGFAALEYSFPDKIKYAYFLEGWDKDWNYVDKQRNAYYSHLNEGKYTLRIKSTDASGIWNNAERIIKIEVLPPWWRSWWAYTAYTLSAIFALSLYFVYVKRQTKLKYRIRLANLETEKERELNEKKLSFFTHIAHEFRTPLTLIVNPIKEILYRGTTDAHADSRELTNIYNNSKRLLSLVDKLLLFRKAESDFDTLRLVKIDIVSLCHEVFLCFKQHAVSRQIDYQFLCDFEHSGILGDRDKLEICLFNLINNAIKFTPSGGKVTMLIKQTDDKLTIQIIDTGCGIPNTVGDSIFKLFHRDYASNSAGKEGFGIGLFLVKKFAETHRGSISYSSGEDIGTCFTLTLLKGEAHFAGNLIFEDVTEHSVFLDELMSDVQQDDLDEIQTDIEQIAEAKKELNDLAEIVTDKPIMLVVDDNQDIRKYIRKTFESEFEVHEAADGETALTYLSKIEPQIVISDVVMGSMSGIDLCATLKKDPALNHIPVILLTASSSPEIKLKGLEGGADDYITKPFDKEILVARVTNLIKSRNRLQTYFYNEITLQSNNHKVSDEYKEFLQRAIAIVEQHLDNPDFTVKMLAEQIGMSHSNLYKRIKSISGKSANEFIRYIRLRKVAQLLINTDHNINEAAFAAGFSDIKYFREQFQKLFRLKPSEYKRKYGTLRNKHKLNMK
ncbi:response regulator [Sphingobacterium olei]|uniref:histidine kinase n=1 Tax=Sphingobacterium olei TaxID=2571155 RepID=A0A4U0P060_9SPHI|nr:two-component regulator propeller domain-containing protein [Sphingobacterium olei]TJZ60493.1 response regulator [Sphingobacterium olei]